MPSDQFRSLTGRGVVGRVGGHEVAAGNEALLHELGVDADELKQFRDAAKHVLALTERQLAELLKRGDFIEVKEDGQEIPK